MSRWVFAVCVAGLLQACGTVNGTVAGDPGREIIGVAAHQPNQDDAANSTPTDAAERKLDWQESQLCTLGSIRLNETVEPGDGDKQIVDRQVRCSPYEFSVFGVSFAGLFPPDRYYWPF